MSSHTRVIASVRRSLLDDFNAAADDSHVFFTPPSKTDDEQFETNIVKKDHQQFEMNCSRIIGKVRKRSFEDNQLNCSTSIRKLSFEDHQLNSSKKVRKISVEDHQLNCSKKVRKISFEDHQAAMKLLNSIERIEKIVMERIKRLNNAPAAKKAEWDRKIRNLMSMRMKYYYAWSAFMRGDLLLVTQAWISQEHVKTKSKAQCIVHFLSFPMDDSSMKNVEVPHIPISVKLSNNDECDRSHSNNWHRIDSTRH
ncbi:hypothetical protein POM88_007136 [Heracleum sosnowskyi]|uniref:Uncharacterized protein n=1 Tax=Heracleum sosnowskyi TaxID=360622 RepID=A0AAD8J672_9APIA|nr:hypothetical protein POM88_007136 [Heracleum sosnowskyi]